MATEVDNLQAALLNVSAKIAAITDPALIKPSYSIDGQSISWGAYYKDLLALRDAIKAALVNAEGPFEFQIQGYS